MRSYISRVGTVISQTVNMVVLNGDPDESISARSYRRGTLEGSKKWRQIQKGIDWLASCFIAEHCKKSYITDYCHARQIIDRGQPLGCNFSLNGDSKNGNS